MWIVFIIIVAFILGLINVISKQKNQNESFKKEGLNPALFISSGKYLSGHTSINNPIDITFIYPTKDVLKIYGMDKGNGTKIFYADIDASLISNIAIEDESSIKSRVGLKRLLLVGIFAFAIKKKEKVELAYLVIDWNLNQFTNETVFEFEGKGALQKANYLRNALINTINGTTNNSNFDDELLNLIRGGANLSATKLYMERTGASLSISKAYVDALTQKEKFGS
jgi:hypothetical protein